jgi:competence protein ComEC
MDTPLRAATGRSAAAATERPGHDLRLVPAALAVWAVMLASILPGAETGAGVGAGLAALGVVVACVVLWRRGSPVVIAIAGCGAAAGLVIAAQLLLVDRHPVRVPAGRGDAAELRVVVGDDPRALRQAGPGQPMVAVPAELVRADVGPQRWSVGGRVLLLAPAEGWSGLLPGQEITAEGLLAPPTRADLTVAVLRVRGPPHDVAPPPWWQSAAGALRAGLRAAAQSALAGPEAGLLPGLAVGDTSGLTADVDADFRAVGLTHLLAVSGANLAILTGGLLWLLRRVRADPRWSAVLAGLAVVGFVVLARPSPSVLRAAVMAAVVLLALGSGRRRAAIPALATAVLVLLLVSPALAVDLGFALSVVATAALVLLAPPWAEALRRRGLPGWAAEALAIPAAASLVTAPLIVGISGQVNPITVVANLLVEPAVAPATVLGVLAALVSPVAPALAHACAWAAGPCVWWMVTVADRSAAVEGITLRWPDGPAGGLLLAGAVLLLAVLVRFRRIRAVLVAVCLGAALVLVPTRLVPVGWPPAGWSVVACDVWQGDAVVLATGIPGSAVLVDTGPDPGFLDGCLSRLGVQVLAMVVVSHLHADHLGGIDGAVHGRSVGAVAVGPGRDPERAFRSLAHTAADAGAPFVSLRPGQRLSWPALVIDVLGPLHPPPHVDPDNGTAINDTSVVLRATTPTGRVLLTGDAELAAQADLLASGVDLRADILKMPHHGSRYSSPEFLAAVRPRAVLVSVGAGNSYGHPNETLLSALVAAGATVRRTDRSGDTAVVAGADTDHDGRPDPEVVERGDPRPAPH